MAFKAFKDMYVLLSGVFLDFALGRKFRSARPLYKFSLLFELSFFLSMVYNISVVAEFFGKKRLLQTKLTSKSLRVG
jgi:hypothetical protein